MKWGDLTATEAILLNQSFWQVELPKWYITHFCEGQDPQRNLPPELKPSFRYIVERDGNLRRYSEAVTKLAAWHESLQQVEKAKQWGERAQLPALRATTKALWDEFEPYSSVLNSFLAVLEKADLAEIALSV